MATLMEVLRAAGIAEEVISGLDKSGVVTALTGYVSDADTKLATASEEKATAEEARRQAELERKEINEYVEKYGTTVADVANEKARADAYETYVKSLKAQGFDVKLPEVTNGGKPAVPGSPAIGQNAVDESQILGKVGSVLSAWLDANNEHIRLYGTPIPDPSTSVAEEANRARKPIGQYLEEKYKFSEAREKKRTETFQKQVDDAANKKFEEKMRQEAERRGNNPMLRGGESSRSPSLPKIKSEDFHKSDGNQTRRERMQRLLNNIHADIEARQQNA